MSLLKEKYGNSFKIAVEYIKQLANWPRLKSIDVASFTKFENFLIKFQTSMSAVGRTTECNRDILQSLQSKLPPHLQDRWNREVYRFRRDSHNEVTLNDFIKQINEDAFIISNPLFLREAITELSKDHETTTTKQRTKGFNTGSNEVCICCVKK